MNTTYPNFHPNRCNICFLKSSTTKPSGTGTLLLCKKCKLIKYCSEEHRKQDAPWHKEFCKAVQSVLQKSGADHVLRCPEAILGKCFNSEPKDLVVFKDFINCTSILISKILKRTLYHYEQTMLSFPLLCNVCMEYRPEKLFFCDNCQQVAYCSAEHQERDRDQHSKWCDELRINFYFGIELSYSSWNNMFPSFAFVEDESIQQPFPKDIFELANVEGGSTRFDLEVEQQLENINTASLFSHVGTILHVLRIVGLHKEIEQELNVYVLGAEKDITFFNPITAAVLFRFLPKLRRLRVYLIGPAVDPEATNVMHFMDNRTVEVEIHRYLFHRLPDQFQLPKPHLVIAYNCGFNEFFGSDKHTWDETIQKVLRIPNVPFAFTSYTFQEAVEDAAIVVLNAQNMTMIEKLRFTQRNVTNPFRVPIPLRNLNPDDTRDLLYYENGYLSVCVMIRD